MNIVVITGVSSGLGADLALEYAARGWGVVGISRGEMSDNRLIDLQNLGQLHSIQGTIADEATVQAAFSCAEKHGKLSALVNCAGVGVFGEIGSFDRHAIDRVLEGNLIGTILFCQEAALRMKSIGGVIANVMSTAAFTSRAQETIYCAAKAGTKGFTDALRVELKGSSIRVIGIYPGGMNTPFWIRAKGQEFDASKFMQSSEVAKYIIMSLMESGLGYTSEIIINRL